MSQEDCFSNVDNHSCWNWCRWNPTMELLKSESWMLEKGVDTSATIRRYRVAEFKLKL